MIKRVKKKFTTPLFKTVQGDDAKIDLLWGDRVRVIDSATSLWKVKARGLSGFVNPSHLGDVSYLELYFIDVGQGDGILIRTPDGKHILLDGGWPRRSQPTGKNAADFVDWKFHKDYEENAIRLDAMVCSHNDQDHYGGLWDLLDLGQQAELDVQNVFVEHFYHAGQSWWRPGNKTLGQSVATEKGAMFTQLLEDRASLVAGLASGANPKLQGEWAKFLRKVKDSTTAAGSPTPVTRLSHATGTLPGFNEGTSFAINVLAPVEFAVDGKPAIRKFASRNSVNTNGNSVLFRINYENVRILLTGDLNTKSQQSLLDDYAGQHGEFECDVAKACHHGSGDVSIKFLEKLAPSCTVISSGDSEGHDHPKPSIVAASGITGFRTVKGDELITPLVYSTEMARSIALGKVTKVTELDNQGQPVREFTGSDLGRIKATYEIVMAGDRGPKSSSGELDHRRVAHKPTYGLINIRTDGKTVMCAALNEKEFKWNVTSFEGRF